MSQKVAYVTGGMGGIGTPICKRLCRDGYTVVAGCGLNSARKDKWLADMRAEGYDIHASEGNVSDWESTSPLPMCIRSLNCLKNMCAYIEANLWSDGLVVVSGIHNLLGAGLL